MVNGNYGDRSSQNVNEIKKWVQKGGTLILQRSAIEWARNQDLLSIKNKEPEEKFVIDKSTPYALLSSATGAQVIGGSIFEATLDVSHPLSYGYPRDTMHILRNSTRFFEGPVDHGSAPSVLTGDSVAGGFISDPKLGVISNTVSAFVSGYGSGR